MVPFNRLMNHVADLSRSENPFTRQISTRVAIVLGGVPLEVLAAFQNLLTLPFQPFGLVSKVVVKTFNICIDSQILKDFEEFLPGLRQIVVTAYKIVAYIIGTFFTGTLGFLSPMSNFYLHNAFGLIVDEDAEADKIQREEEELRKREAHEAMVQAQIQNMLFTMRQKAIEQERLKAEEAQKEKYFSDSNASTAIDKGKQQEAHSFFMKDNEPVEDKQKTSTQTPNHLISANVNKPLISASRNPINGIVNLFKRIYR